MTDIAPFLRQFEGTHDWRIWGIIADYFADDEDDVGERWALWIRDNRVKPIACRYSYSFDSWSWHALRNKRVRRNPLASERLHAEMDYPQLVRINEIKENPRYGIANAYTLTPSTATRTTNNHTRYCLMRLTTHLSAPCQERVRHSPRGLYATLPLRLHIKDATTGKRLACVYKVFGGFVLELQDGIRISHNTAAEAVNTFCHIAKIESTEVLRNAANEMERHSADINKMAELLLTSKRRCSDEYRELLQRLLQLRA